MFDRPMKTVAAAVLLARFDGGGVGAVAQPEHRGEDEERLDAERLPDPPAEQRDQDGDQVVDGDAGGDGGAHFFGIVREVLDVDVTGHGSQRDD